MDPSEEAASFPCPHCGVELVVNPKAVSTTGPCPDCGRILTVPGRSPEPVNVAPAPAPAAPAIPPEPSEPIPAPPPGSAPGRARDAASTPAAAPARRAGRGARFLAVAAAGCALAAAGLYGLPRWPAGPGDSAGHGQSSAGAETSSLEDPGVDSLADAGAMAERRPGAGGRARNPSPSPPAEATPVATQSGGRRSPAPAAPAPTPQLQPAPPVSPEPPRAEPIPESPPPKAVPIDPPATQRTEPAAPKPPPARPKGVIGEAHAALGKFLAARDLKERTRFVRNAGRIRSRMAAYYQESPDADGPEEVESIRFVQDHPIPDSEYRFYVFEIIRKADGLPVPVCVEQTKQGYVVDWEAYVEARDRRFEKYCESWKDEPGVFRILLERVHYWEDDVPDQDSKVPYKALGPAPGRPFVVWVHKVTPVFARHFQNTERMNWDTLTFPIARLRWVRDRNSGAQWIQLQDIVSDSWRTD